MIVVKSCYQAALPINLFIHLCCKMCRLGTMHSVRDRRTDRQTDNIITPMGDQYDRLIKMTQTNKKIIFLELQYRYVI